MIVQDLLYPRRYHPITFYVFVCLYVTLTEESWVKELFKLKVLIGNFSFPCFTFSVIENLVNF